MSFLISDCCQWFRYWFPSNRTVSGKSSMKFNNSVLKMIIRPKTLQFCMKKYETIFGSYWPQNSDIFSCRLVFGMYTLQKFDLTIHFINTLIIIKCFLTSKLLIRIKLICLHWKIIFLMWFRKNNLIVTRLHFVTFNILFILTY